MNKTDYFIAITVTVALVVLAYELATTQLQIAVDKASRNILVSFKLTK